MCATPIETEAFATMERHLVEATVQLYEAYGLAVRHSGSSPNSPSIPAEESVLAIIGYAGVKVRGALILVASQPAVESWRVALGESDTRADVCDTLGEFSNMLLGRLKACLLPEGLPILMSTPTTASGVGLSLARAVKPSTWLTFDGPGWNVNVRVDATFEEGFALQEHEDREDPAQAGEMMLF
jgi:CheY-specific phosphatase CheX